MGGPRERTDDEGLVQTAGVESDCVRLLRSERERGLRGILSWTGQGRAAAQCASAERAWLNLVSASRRGAAILRNKKSDQRAVPRSSHGWPPISPCCSVAESQGSGY
ncbi:hypothetical protein V8C26DRAFT_393436, partial [Trichoderma gracile]